MMNSNTYPEIIFQDNLLDTPSSLSFLSHYPQIMIISDTGVAPLYLEKLLNILKSISQVKQVDFIIISKGDEHKTLENAQKVFTHLIEKHYYRETLLIALGGGMIGDLTGFCAACYLRGVDYIQMPTTLLAQVDASIGGKTGVNHPLGKNLIGAFYQPKAVLCDPTFLHSLSEREFIAGLAEVIKYGLALEADFFNWIESHIHSILEQDSKVMAYLVRHCIDLKLQITSKDEREKGNRIFLNFGHTLAHAIEAVLAFKNILHGEAVGIGLLAAVALSEKVCQLDSSVFTRLESLLEKIGLLTTIPSGMSVYELMQTMQMDKKNKKDKIQWVLLTHLGKAKVISDIPSQEIEAVLVKMGAH